MMKTLFKTALICIILFLLWSCTSSKEYYYPITKNYKPDDPKLYETIVVLDSLFFNAYNTCEVNLEKYGNFYADDIEFYHDNGGIMTSKKAIIEGTQKNICGKVTRELVI
ncbi:nuclear transport factor 2 family protein [Flavobacterium geliluteum]|uniref:hypothetical protein n=1 Tax=Flavobacterium geliluteum TaxID=2816120 RepID=UPI001F35A88C|nr:hypothetical protein [Flavobacterium geliluteum]